MSAEEKESPALVRTRASALTSAGPKSLVERGRDLLRNKEEAAEWLRKGLELRDAAPDDPRVRAPINPYAVTSAKEETKLRIAIEYGRLIKLGDPAEVAAKKLHMTGEDQEYAKAVHFFMPDALTKFADDEERRIRELVRKREEMLREAFCCFENGLELDPIHPELLCRLGDSYYFGHGINRNEEKAADVYRRAAERGHAEAQCALGVLYSSGEGVELDEAVAAVWLRKAAEQGNSDAQLFLGLAYQSGRGVPNDDAMAAFWIRKASERANETSAGENTH